MWPLQKIVAETIWPLLIYVQILMINWDIYVPNILSPLSFFLPSRFPVLLFNFRVLVNAVRQYVLYTIPSCLRDRQDSDYFKCPNMTMKLIG